MIIVINLRKNKPRYDKLYKILQKINKQIFFTANNHTKETSCNYFQITKFRKINLNKSSKSYRSIYKDFNFDSKIQTYTQKMRRKQILKSNRCKMMDAFAFK